MTAIGFIGLGLIGGSLARSIRKNIPDIRLIAYDADQTALQSAVSEKIIDLACNQYDAAFCGCDMIFLCAPVQSNLEYLSFLKDNTGPNCILTDVGSVKGNIEEAVASLHLSERFIGGHPMAGTEKAGFANSNDYLFENAYYFITPSEQSRPDDVIRYQKLIEKIHAIPIVLTAQEHDRIVAGVSHLPHIVASSLVNTVKYLDTEEERMKLVAAGGFRDITRIASSSPEIWEQICISNKEAILEALDAYIRLLEKARISIQTSDKHVLHDMFSSSRNYRDSIDDTHRGSVPRQYVLYLDIYDEAGGIATITTLLAMNQINIRNIGILHNREFEEGVLRIEFYDEQSRDHSEDVLKKRNYIVRKII